MSVVRVFTQSILGLALALQGHVTLAQGSSLNEELNRLQQAREAEKEQLILEKQKVAEELLRLNERSSEIDQEMTALQASVSLDFNLAELKDLLTKTFGVCQVTGDAVPLVYYVKKDDVEIRLSFQDVLDNVVGKISKKQVGLNNQEVIEINIVPRYPNGHEASRTAVLIRLHPETLDVVHATFTGLRINDRLLGWGNSLTLYQMVCEL